jgi:hypothetical protein
MSSKSTKSLYQLQSLMADAIMRPLKNDSMQSIWLDGGDTAKYAAQFIKPNQRLSSFERLEIYNKQYWYRLLESLQDDFPGLNALLGHKRFEKLSIAYLNRYPSRSYTLNHLAKDLANFIKEEPNLTAPDTEVAHEIACLEWAEIQAFEGTAKPILNAESLKQSDPVEIMLQIQPYLTLLSFSYAVDNFLLGLNKEHTKSIESNAVVNRTVRFSKSSYVKKRRTYLAIHRLNNVVYYKRLDKDQYFLLKSLMANTPLAQACNELIGTKKNVEDQQTLALKINKSFATWMELGWFCQMDTSTNT